MNHWCDNGFILGDLPEGVVPPALHSLFLMLDCEENIHHCTTFIRPNVRARRENYTLTKDPNETCCSTTKHAVAPLYALNETCCSTTSRYDFTISNSTRHRILHVVLDQRTTRSRMTVCHGMTCLGWFHNDSVLFDIVSGFADPPGY